MGRLLGTLGMVSILLLLLAAPALAIRPASGFVGSWAGIDPSDGSNITITIRGDKTVQAVMTDDNATAACAGASTAVFDAVLVGKVDGSEMATRITAAMCGTEPVTFVHGMQMFWWLDDMANADPADDVLANDFGEEYRRTN